MEAGFSQIQSHMKFHLYSYMSCKLILQYNLYLLMCKLTISTSFVVFLNNLLCLLYSYKCMIIVLSCLYGWMDKVCNLGVKEVVSQKCCPSGPAWIGIGKYPLQTKTLHYFSSFNQCRHAHDSNNLVTNIQWVKRHHVI